MEMIREARLRQPLRELQRKALKSHNRANLWTQEEIDYADAVALRLHGRLSRPRRNVSTLKPIGTI